MHGTKFLSVDFFANGIAVRDKVGVNIIPFFTCATER